MAEASISKEREMDSVNPIRLFAAKGRVDSRKRPLIGQHNLADGGTGIFHIVGTTPTEHVDVDRLESRTPALEHAGRRMRFGLDFLYIGEIGSPDRTRSLIIGQNRWAGENLC